VESGLHGLEHQTASCFGKISWGRAFSATRKGHAEAANRQNKNTDKTVDQKLLNLNLCLEVYNKMKISSPTDS
jgi:hypothetical protein